MNCSPSSVQTHTLRRARLSSHASFTVSEKSTLVGGRPTSNRSASPSFTQRFPSGFLKVGETKARRVGNPASTAAPSALSAVAHFKNLRRLPPATSLGSSGIRVTSVARCRADGRAALQLRSADRRKVLRRRDEDLFTEHALKDRS